MNFIKWIAFFVIILVLPSLLNRNSSLLLKNLIGVYRSPIGEISPTRINQDQYDSNYICGKYSIFGKPSLLTGLYKVFITALPSTWKKC